MAVLMHVDLNAFFAEAELLRHPEYRGKPLAVGGKGRRGVVSTASYEARKYGVGSGMPSYQAKAACPNLIFLPVDFSYYEMLSSSFFNYLKRYSPLVEPISIDEGYVDITKALEGVEDPMGFVKQVQRGLLLEIGLKCSIGVAPNRFLAKMASDMKKPMGITVLRRRDVPRLLWPLPVSSFYGIGRKSVPLLQKAGYKTIGELAEGLKRGDPYLVSFFGKNYREVLAHAYGQGNDRVEVVPAEPKSIGRSLTLEQDSNDPEEIESRLESLCLEVGASLKRERKEGMGVSLTVREPSFKNHSKSLTYEVPVSDGKGLYEKALALYEEFFLGISIRLIGVTVFSLRESNSTDIQMSFFDYGDYEKKDATKLMVQEWNRRLEGPVLMVASQVSKKKDGTK